MRTDFKVNYYKMCESAIELQEKWKPVIGDYVKVKNYKKLQIIASINNIVLYFESKQNYDKKDCIWIPSKEQLNRYLKPYGMWFKFYEFIHYGWKKYIQNFKSEEELLLAFVMQYFYKKDWKNSQWILHS